MPVSSSNFTRTTSSTASATEPHCHNCGASYNKPTAKFCSRCGTKKAANNTSATTSPRQQPSTTNTTTSSGITATRTSNNSKVVVSPSVAATTSKVVPSVPVSSGASVPNTLTRLNSTGGLVSAGHPHHPSSSSPSSSSQRRESNVSNDSAGGVYELRTPDAAGNGRQTLRPSDNVHQGEHAVTSRGSYPNNSTNASGLGGGGGTAASPMPPSGTTAPLGTKPGSTRRSFASDGAGAPPPTTTTSPAALDATSFNTKSKPVTTGKSHHSTHPSSSSSNSNSNTAGGGSGGGAASSAETVVEKKSDTLKEETSGVYKSIVVEPTPAQEQKYSAWATLGPKGLTPEMLMTENADELAGWKKGTLIGRGTYGSVYLGLLADGSFYAVKCVELGKEATESINPAELVSLSREINMMQRLQHKNLCEFKGVWYDAAERHMCMFMQYIGGGSLTSFVKKFKPLPPDVVRGWTKQLLSGLLYLHSQHIIHRDIKGENVLVDTSADPASGAQIKLVDFGAARRLTDAVSQSKTVIGTPYWMAPEVVDFSGEGGGYSYKADVWSVGCTVAEMLTGSPPWPTRANAPSTIMMIATATDGPTEIPEKEATPGCLDFMKKCFVRDPEKRPTVEELLHHPWIRGEME